MGLVMIVFLGIMQKESIQIEWFFFSILAGLLVGALSHYLIAKVLGPLVFARLSCADGAVRSALTGPQLVGGFSGPSCASPVLSQCRGHGP